MTPEPLGGPGSTQESDFTPAESRVSPSGAPLADDQPQPQLQVQAQAVQPSFDLGSASADDDLSPFDTVPYDPARARESVRGIIALSLIALLAAVIIASFVLLWIHPDRVGELHSLLGLVFAPLIALVGAATGYYFGSHEGR